MILCLNEGVKHKYFWMLRSFFLDEESKKFISQENYMEINQQWQINSKSDISTVMYGIKYLKI